MFTVSWDMAARSTFKISDAVRDVLARSTITATTVTLPPEQLERKLYTEVNKALEGAGGKWNRSKKLHVFERDPREALGLAVETGKATNIRTALQAFYTPDVLADRVVAATGIARDPVVVAAKAGKRTGRPVVLEPSVGAGALACAVIRATGGHAFIQAYDIDPVACAAASKAIPAALREQVRLQTRDVAELQLGYSVAEVDFLKVSRRDSICFDYIVMNPPFAGGADIRHVTHAYSLLDDGGVLAAIMWPAWQTAETRAAADFRVLYRSAGGTIEDIPGGTFEHTDMATVLVVLRKPAAPPEDDEVE